MLSNKNCKICNGMGYIVDDNKVYDCKCFIQEALKKMYDQAGIPRVFQQTEQDTSDFITSFKNSNHSADAKWAVAVADAFIDHIINNNFENELFFFEDTINNYERTASGNTIVLSGGKKSGKSLLSAIIAKTVIKNSNYINNVSFMEWSTIFNVCLSYYENENYNKVKDNLDNNTLVVIDDIDYAVENLMEQNRGYTLSRIDTSFSIRNKLNLPTIFTTSHTDIKSLIDDNELIVGSIVYKMITDATVINIPSLSFIER